jgi:hypothetical protein
MEVCVESGAGLCCHKSSVARPGRLPLSDKKDGYTGMTHAFPGLPLIGRGGGGVSREYIVDVIGDVDEVYFLLLRGDAVPSSDGGHLKLDFSLVSSILECCWSLFCSHNTCSELL